MYSVKGGRLYMPRQLPKSAIFTTSPISKMFSLIETVKIIEVRFDIPVKDPIAVHMFDSLKYLVHIVFNSLFVQVMLSP